MDILSTAAIFFLVLDAFGNIPIVLAVLKKANAQDYTKIVARELIIAFGILSLFLVSGQYILKMLQISQSSIQISGGVVLFIIALKMIFGGSETLFQGSENEHPFIVPIAVPLFAGPSSIATVIFTASKYAEHRMDVWLALLLAWFASAIVVLGAKYIRKALGNRGLLAMERLMGMLLTAIAVEMFFQGIKAVFLKA